MTMALLSDRCWVLDESGCSGLQPQLGGRSHPKLNIWERPIAKKYCEGKVKRTLKRRSKVLEIVKREAYGISECMLSIQPVRPLIHASETESPAPGFVRCD